MILGETTPNPSFSLGNILGRVDVDTQDLRVSVSTIEPMQRSVVNNGAFALDEQQIETKNGIITAQGSVFLVGEIDETINLSQTPLVFMPTGTGTLSLVEATDPDPNDFLIPYEVTLSIPIDVSESFEVTTGVNATFTLQGVDSMDEDIKATGTFSISIAPEGDYNNDGVVDLADYTVWRNNVGSANGTLPNDPNSTPIGAEQYDTWKQNFGSTAPSQNPLQNSPVPEPNSLIFMAGSVLIAYCIGMNR